MKIRFETLKLACGRKAYNEYNQGFYSIAQLNNLALLKEGKKPKDLGDGINEVKREVFDHIMRTDIRNVKSLATAFPSVVPAWVRNGNYFPELTDNGWELIKIETD